MSPPCPHSHRAPTDPALLEQALVEARARCEAAGESWTQPRRRTYELLVGAGHPVKAYDLIQRFGEGGRPTKPPTVYRSLDLLMAIGLVQKVITLGAYMACPDSSGTSAAGLLVCTCCGAVERLPDPSLVATCAAPAGFLVERVMLEASGLCPRCH